MHKSAWTIMTKILISEIRHCIGIIKTGDTQGGIQRLSQLADNLQHFEETKIPKPVDDDWYQIALALFKVSGLRKYELRVITAQNRFLNAQKKIQ